MKIGKIATVLITLVLWLGFAVTIGASDNDSPPIIVLTGVLKSKTKWGPPGFGETTKLDSKVVIFVLKLQEPLTAKQLSLPEGRKKGEERCGMGAGPGEGVHSQTDIFKSATQEQACA